MRGIAWNEGLPFPFVKHWPNLEGRRNLLGGPYQFARYLPVCLKVVPTEVVPPNR